MKVEDFFSGVLIGLRQWVYLRHCHEALFHSFFQCSKIL